MHTYLYKCLFLYSVTRHYIIIIIINHYLNVCHIYICQARWTTQSIPQYYILFHIMCSIHKYECLPHVKLNLCAKILCSRCDISIQFWTKKEKKKKTKWKPKFRNIVDVDWNCLTVLSSGRISTIQKCKMPILITLSVWIGINSNAWANDSNDKSCVGHSNTYLFWMCIYSTLSSEHVWNVGEGSSRFRSKKYHPDHIHIKLSASQRWFSNNIFHSIQCRSFSAFAINTDDNATYIKIASVQ